jgi:pimeloyl-ACP methyl ester carboxylesterase
MAPPAITPQDGAMKRIQPDRSIWLPIVGIISISIITTTALFGCAGTPPIETEGLSPIASREYVEINGTRQGVVIRGHDRNAPVLLWLAGGPGGSEIGWTTHYLGNLEEDVVFVNWDQRGTGLSYRAGDWDAVETNDFVADTIAMSEYLIRRFNTDTVILVGHSWGSIVGLQAVARRPDLFSAYVGVGQQVNTLENDRIGYEMVMTRASRRQDTRVVEHLRTIGPPPYPRELGRHYLYLFQKVHMYSTHPSPEPTFATMVFPEEYTLRNSINLIRGLLKGVINVYPQLHDLDFESSIPSVDVPVFFFTGRYDETCVQDIAFRYYERIEAPHKEFVWFERSGHNVPYQQPERFVSEMRRRVLHHISDRRKQQ